MPSTGKVLYNEKYIVTTLVAIVTTLLASSLIAF